MTKFADVHLHLDATKEETVVSFLDTLSDIGITDASLLSLVEHHKHSKIQNILVLYWKNRYKKIKLRAFGALHETDKYKNVPYEKQIESLLDIGCDGIKFIHMKPDLRKLLGCGLDDPTYDKALSILEERGVPVVIHSGDPETFWDITKMQKSWIERGWFYGDGTYPSYLDIYEEDFRMLDKHPKLKVDFAHFFFLSNRIDEARRVMEKYPNVSFDLTPGWEMYVGFSEKIDQWHDFFVTYSDRIMFGTDSNSTKDSNRELNLLVKQALTHDRSEFPMPCFGGNIIKGLDLPTDVVEKICYKNYVRFVGENTAQVDEDAVYARAERMLSDFTREGGYENEVNWLKELFDKR